jgi:hypothetical protein
VLQFFSNTHLITALGRNLKLWQTFNASRVGK